MKYAKYTLLPILIALIFLLLALPDLTGKPLFRSPAYNTAEAYLAEHYADLDLAIGDISWNDHGGDYHVNIYSPSSPDTKFTLVVGSRSKAVEQDTYAQDVLGGENTADRLYWEYRTLADSLLEDPAFPFDHNSSYGLLLLDEENTANLVPDGTYDVRELGAKAGFLELHVQTEDLTAECAAQLLLALKNHMDAQNFSFCSVDLILWTRPIDPNSGTLGNAEELNVSGFLYADIYAEGLEERVQAHIKP